MKYKISLNDEDYLRFNIFYAHHSKAGKRSMNMTRMAVPILALTFIMVLWIAGASHGLIVTEAAALALVSIVWCMGAPKITERMIRKNIGKVRADGKLPYHADAEVEFQESRIVERSEQGEIHVNYGDIENIYPDKEYLYIFYSALQALIIPYRCLGGDKERVVKYVMKKRNG